MMRIRGLLGGRSFIFLLLLLLFVDLSAQQLLPQFLVLGLNPTTRPNGDVEFVGRTRLLGFLAGVADINSDPSFPFILEDENFDNQRDIEVTVAGALARVNRTIGFCGPQRSSVTLQLHPRVALPFRIPIVSPASTSLTLSPASDFPYFLRAFPSSAVVAASIASLIEFHSEVGETVSLLTRTPDAAAEDYRRSLLKFAEESSVWSITQDIQFDIALSDAELNGILDQLISVGNRVFIVICLDAGVTARYFKFGYQKGIAGIAGYQWIFDSVAAGDSSFVVGGVRDPEAVLGWEGGVSVTPSDGQGEIYDQFRASYERERQLQEEIETFLEVPDPKAAFIYDIMFMYAHAIRQMLLEGKDPADGTLIDYLREVSFPGATGTLAFNPGFNDRAGITPIEVILSVQGERFLRGSISGPEVESNFIWKGQSVYHIGSLLSLSEPAGRSRWLALQACINDHNNDNWAVVGTFRLSLVNEDTNNDPDTAVAGAQSLLQSPKVGFIGTETPEVTEAVHNRVAAPNKIPLLSGVTSAMEFQSANNYPYFLRTYPSAFFVASGVVTLLNNNAGDGLVAMLYREDNPLSVALHDTFISLSSGADWVVDAQYGVAMDHTNFEDILLDLQKRTIKIVVVFLMEPESVAHLFSQAFEVEMAGDGSGYQWIVDDVSVSLDSYRIDGVISSSAVQGWRSGVGFLASSVEGPITNRFLRSYDRELEAQEDPSLFPEIPDNTAAFHYDMCGVYVNALSEVIKEGGDVFDGDLLMSKLRLVMDTEGASGRISFDQNDRVGTFSYQLLQGNGFGSFQPVGVWDGETLREEGFLWAVVNQQFFTLGSLLSEGTVTGRSALLSIRAAINDINKDSPVAFSLLQRDTHNKANSEIINSALELVEEQGVIGLLGVESSSLAIAIHTEVGEVHSVPLFSAAAVAASIRSSTDFPFFLRDYPSTSPESMAIAALLEKYVSKENVCVLYRPDELNSVSLKELVEAKSAGSKWEINSEISVRNQDDFTNVFKMIEENDCKVVLSFLFDDEMTWKILGHAYSANLAGSGSLIQWVVDNAAFSSALIQGSEAERSGWEGASGFIANRGKGEENDQFLLSYARERSDQNPDLYPEVPEPKASYYYDLVYVYLSAVKAVLDAGGDPHDGVVLMSAMREVNQLKGATGELSFDENDRAQDVFLDFVGGKPNGEYQLQGSYSQTTDFSENGVFSWSSTTSSSASQIRGPPLLIVVASLFLTKLFYF